MATATKKLTVRNGGKNRVILRAGRGPAKLLGTVDDAKVPDESRPSQVVEFDGEAAETMRKSKAFQALVEKQRYGLQVA